MRTTAVALLAVALLGACGSDSGGGGSQTIDEFLDVVDATCRTGTKQIEKLDASDSGAIGDLIDYVKEIHDDLDKMEPPESLSRDFGRLTSKFDDEVGALQQLETAIGAGDQSGIDAAVTDVNTLRSDADTLAKELGALKCRNVTPENGLAPEASTTSTETTTETTTTETPGTDPPVCNTIAEDTPTTDTVLPVDLSLGTPAPEGFRWIETSPVDVKGLYEKPTVGPLVDFYGGGRLENIADESTASIYLVSLCAPWTDEAIAEYQFWEGVEDGTDTQTPTGIPVRQAFGAFEDTDCVVFTGGSSGITVCTFTDVDGLPILDAFVAANGSG